MPADALTAETVELLQQLIRNACVNDGTAGSGQEVRSADVLTTYLDGARVGQAADVPVTAAQIVDQTARASNRLFIGRSQDDAAPAIHARLRDVRIYRIALHPFEAESGF